ncbi:hypothetical protein LDENG_00230440 [Lucifuga dentata]|nr:hypothetical protein LDENG_00230440 [Lucifuga dentata]
MEALLESDQEEEEEEEEEMKMLRSIQDQPANDTLRLTCDQILDACPESYTMNSDMELKLLSIVENFHRQYSHFFPERKALLLSPENECGVKKFVCTTLRPTPPSLPELQHWRGCAAFVADFLSLQPLESPINLVRKKKLY